MDLLILIGFILSILAIAIILILNIYYKRQLKPFINDEFDFLKNFINSQN